MSSSFPAPPPRYADDSGTSLASCILIILGLLAFVLVASLSISACLGRRSNRSRPSPPPSPLPATHRRDDWTAEGKKDLIESLPRFTMASALAALPKSSPDCAVCLSPFRPEAELRLLPACRHAFHAVCVDAWLRTTPTCPLCRATVAPPHPSIAALLAAEQPPPPEPAAARSRDRSRRFRVEMGSVSSRGGSPATSTGSDDSRTYSLGSFEYHIDEEVEAVVSRMVRAAARAETVKEEKPAAQGSPSPPGEAVAEAAGTPTRGWLREYVDRLASSASSFSYSFSGRWSSWWSQGQQGHRQEEPWLWDAEAATVPPPPPPGPDEEVETTFMVLYRWIAAV